MSIIKSLLEEFGLSKTAREAVPFIKSLVDAQPDLSATNIVEQARAIGLRFDNTPIFRLIRQFKENLAAASEFGITDHDEVPSKDALGVGVGVMDKNYSFLVRITGYNPVTGQQEQRFVTVVSDNLLTLSEIRQTAINIPSGKPGSGVLERTTVTPIEGLKSKFVR